AVCIGSPTAGTACELPQPGAGRADRYERAATVAAGEARSVDPRRGRRCGTLVGRPPVPGPGRGAYPDRSETEYGYPHPPGSGRADARLCGELRRLLAGGVHAGAVRGEPPGGGAG